MIGYFIVTITDSDGNEVKLITPSVTWLEGGDDKVRIKAYVGVDNGKILDEWEKSKTKVNVKIEPKCETIEGPTECPESIREYASQEGTATIEWTYNPLDESEITINFEVVE